MSLESEIEDLLRQALPANSNKRALKSYLNKKTFKCFSIILLIILSIGFGHFATVLNKNPESLFSIEKSSANKSSKKIGIREKAILRHSIQKLATQENKHPNSIHNELKYQFKYRSYKNLKFETYVAIMGYIKSRLNESDQVSQKNNTK